MAYGLKSEQMEGSQLSSVRHETLAQLFAFMRHTMLTYLFLNVFCPNGNLEV